MGHKKASFIEKIAEKVGIIPDLHKEEESLPPLVEPGNLTNFPPPEKWDSWTEYEATSWPKKEKKEYSIIPTTCFNCESACGLTAYVDKKKWEYSKIRRKSISSRESWKELRKRACNN